MKCIYTYWAPTPKSESCGFHNTKDLAIILSLSVEYSKKQFKKVELVTNIAGKKLLVDKYKIDFTSVDTSLEGLQLLPELWAFAKLKSYALQKEPFVAIDLDCVLYQRIPTAVKKAPLFFQHKEDFHIQPGYKHLVKAIESTSVGYFCKRSGVDYAYNCGVVGVSDLNIVKEWYDMAENFITLNQEFWRQLKDKGQMNYVFEQFFIACLAKMKKIDKKIRFLLPDFDFTNIERPKFKMLHVWGKNKQNIDQMDRVKIRLKKEFFSVYNRINKIPVDRNGLFDDLMLKGGEKYQKLLKRVIKEKKIQSVVYLGYNLGESLYIGTDKRIYFLYDVKVKNDFPKCDLLIIKDLVPGWSGEQLCEFIMEPKHVKYIMDAGKLHKIKK